MITKRQALDEMKRIKKEREQSPVPQSELARYYELEKVVKHYEAIAAISDSIGWRKEQTVEWYTPPEYIEKARKVMGGIYTDPASNLIAQEWIKARKFYTQETDGLNHQWVGQVWCNPPYGNLQQAFLEKAIYSYRQGRIESAILLLNRTGAAWYLKWKSQCSAICEAYKRIAFISPEGIQEKSPRYYNDFLYLGDDVDRFKDSFEDIGNVQVKQNRQENQS